jgi:hypothetical protein
MPIFQGIDLNDSYVLSWELASSRLVFHLEVSIWPESKYYAPPKPNEYTCYRKGTLSFENLISLSGLQSMTETVSSTDSQGEIDFGNIDDLESTESGFSVYGDFGEVNIDGGELRFEVKM